LFYNLQFYNVGCLWAAAAFNDFELDFLAFFKAFETFFLNSGIVNENVIAAFNFDKAITFFCVEPFYFTVLHVNPPKTLRKRRNFNLTISTTYIST